MKRKRVQLHSLGRKIKYLRQNKEVHGIHNGKEWCGKGYTQQEFAELLNVSIDTVKNWEQGWNYPSIDALVEISQVLECDFDYLLGDQEAPNKYAGLSDSAAKALYDAYRSNDDLCEIVSDLLERQEILRQMQILLSSDYAHFSAVTLMPGFNSSGSIRVSMSDKKNADIMRLFLLLWSYLVEKKPDLVDPLRWPASPDLGGSAQ